MNDDLVNLAKTVSTKIWVRKSTIREGIMTISGLEVYMEPLMEQAKILGYEFIEITNDEYVELCKEM